MDNGIILPNYIIQLTEISTMNVILSTYHEKLCNTQQVQKQSLRKIMQSYMDALKLQLQQSAVAHYKRYNLHKMDLHAEMSTIQYYLKLYESSLKQIQGQQTQNQWAQTIKKVNLYSLFKQIDDKLLFNRALLQDFKFFCLLPSDSNNKFEQLISKVAIMQQQQRQYCQIINSLLTKINRSGKQELLLFNQVQNKYRNLLAVNPFSAEPQIKIKDTLNYVVSSLNAYKFVREADLEIVVSDGIMKQEQYIKLGEGLYNHRFYLKTVKIKLMDMQFCQQKCDTLKRYLKKLKILSKLTIQNYYSECKLGQFTDFSWHPYRKSVNIRSGVWK